MLSETIKAPGIIGSVRVREHNGAAVVKIEIEQILPMDQVGRCLDEIISAGQSVELAFECPVTEPAPTREGRPHLERGFRRKRRSFEASVDALNAPKKKRSRHGSKGQLHSEI